MGHDLVGLRDTLLIPQEVSRMLRASLARGEDDH